MTNDSISNKLSELFDLFKSGALTQEEYDQLKSEIVNQGGKQPVKEKVQKEEPVKEAIRKIVIEQPIIEKVQEKEPVKVLKKEIVIEHPKELNDKDLEPNQSIVEPVTKSTKKLGKKAIIAVIVSILIVVSVILLVFKTTKFSGKSGSSGQNTQTVNDVDGNAYKTVIIGSQVWMAENLKTTKYNDGTTIPLNPDEKAWETLSTPSYCWYDNNETVNKNTYGVLYNWYAVNTNKLCPTGWHVPTNEEWTTLITYLGGEDVSGGKLKETGTFHWKSPNTGATNETGFTALPSGYLLHLGTFKGIGSIDFWWSASEYDATHAWNSNVSYNHSKVNRNNYMFQNGLSVRCLRDLGTSKNNLPVNNTPIVENKTAVWDSTSATKIIMDELKKYPDWSKKAVNDTTKWHHEIISFNKISLIDKDLMVAITLSENKSIYRYWSIFEFEDRDGWKLGKRSIAFAQDNGFEKNLYNIAPNNYCLLFKVVENAMGGRVGLHRDLYAYINGELKLIFSIQQNWQNIGENSIGSNDLKLNFITKSDGYYDIQLTEIDNKAGDNLTLKTVIYKFNGVKYGANKDASIVSSESSNKDIDGNVYKTVTIGKQVWMKENLKTTKYRNGDLIGTTTKNITSERRPKYQWAYDNNESNVATYGRLYTWYAVTDSRNVCPTGWHVPTEGDWITLRLYLENNGYGYVGEQEAIAKSMAATSGWWTDPNASGVGNAQASNNRSGFTGIPSGWRDDRCNFLQIGDVGIWWSASQYAASLQYDRNRLLNVGGYENEVFESNSNIRSKYPACGYSVRCLKDKEFNYLINLPK
jgi:uncharacterized protein (TIGR02145 family)